MTRDPLIERALRGGELGLWYASEWLLAGMDKLAGVRARLMARRVVKRYRPE